MKKIRKLFTRVLGMHDRTLSAEKKLFLAMNFGCLPAMLFSVIMNIINNFPPEQNTVIAVSSIFFIYTYYTARVKKNYKVSMTLFFTVSWLLIASGWFYSGGISGTIPIIFVYFLVMSMLCLERKDYKWLLPLCILIFIICYFIELFFPESVVKLSEETRVGDYIASNIMGFFLLSFVIYYFKKSFDRDRRRLKRKHIMLTQAWERLKIENKRAEDALSVKTQFLANISHEIRTPLNGILGYSEILADTEMNETQIQYLSVIKKSGSLLLSIVNDVLDISKIESGKMDLEHTVFNLREVVLDSVKLIELSIRNSRKNLFLNIEIAEDLPDTFKGDSLRISQIFLNLLGNAVKFTPAGQINFRLRKDAEKNALHITVSDTGIGIDEDTVGKLFEPFTQADISITRKYGGTGLGLAICRKLTNMMGGEIGVNTVKGKGSDFFVYLPFDSGV